MLIQCHIERSTPTVMQLDGHKYVFAKDEKGRPVCQVFNDAHIRHLLKKEQFSQVFEANEPAYAPPEQPAGSPEPEGPEGINFKNNEAPGCASANPLGAPAKRDAQVEVRRLNRTIHDLGKASRKRSTTPEKLKVIKDRIKELMVARDNLCALSKRLPKLKKKPRAKSTTKAKKCTKSK